jgi:mannose-1-phosphate guanylyltransferase
MRDISPFILCGGSGTRLWPLSREAFPKQFHKLTGAETLFQQTCRRFTGDLFGDLFVLSNHRHRFLIAEQLEASGLPATNIVLEPVSRNTAPAACIAALLAVDADPDRLVLLSPSDHMIADTDVFATAVTAGLGPARAGALVIFGITPDSPHTGYGYIEAEGDGPVLTVKRFVEKPSREAAEAYLDQGGFYWNAGIFLLRAKVLLELFETHAPDILAACRLALQGAVEDLTFKVLGEAYGRAPSISLDYAIAERAPNIACVPLTGSWSDAGSWSAVWNFMDKDVTGNVTQGEGEIILEATRNSSGQMHHGEAWRKTIAAEPPPPFRALDRGEGDARDHQGRGDRAPEREPIHLYPHRGAAPPRQSRQDPGLSYRGPIRVLSRRERHRAPGRHLWPRAPRIARPARGLSRHQTGRRISSRPEQGPQHLRSRVRREQRPPRA